jgi:hypothetical protein
MRAALARGGTDSQLDVADGLSFGRQAIGVLKKLIGVFEHDDALGVRIAETAFIPDREQLLADVLAIIDTKLSGSSENLIRSSSRHSFVMPLAMSPLKEGNAFGTWSGSSRDAGFPGMMNRNCKP